MQYRTFGRTEWRVSEIGYGMWGMAGWTGSDDEESSASLDRAVALGCNFFDTAWAYGDGRSEQLLGALLKRHAGKRLYTATKIPPKNRRWPARAEYPLRDVFPPDYIREYTEKSLKNLDAPSVDLQQFHVWTDAWAEDDEWQRAVADLKAEGLVRAIGISINRWQPANVLKALATDLIDAVQVVYNIFDQAPEDELFVECRRRNIAVIARVPFDEGSLTDTLTPDTTWPEGDFRNIYFQPENLRNTLERVAKLRPVLDRVDLRERSERSHANGAGPGAPASERVGESEGRSPLGDLRERSERSHANGAGPGAPASERVGESEGRSPSEKEKKMSMPELALRHILQHPAVGTVIPGMRKLPHVEQNLSASDGRPLAGPVMDELRRHRWDRWIDIP